MPRRTEHQYRFRGSIAPTADVKRPVRAEQPADTPGVGTIHLDDVIDSWGGYWGISASEFNEALAELGDVEHINLHINSPGGEVYEGIAILNALRRHKATVTAVVDGLAASAASFIAVGVDKTVMAPNTELMIHDAWGIAMGPAADMHAMGDRLDTISNNIASVYAGKAGATAEHWRAFMLAETWYSAEEAVAAGLADEVEGSTELGDPGEIIENAFDLSVFKHSSRAAAPKPAMPRTGPAKATASPPDDRRERFTQLRAARHHRRAAANA
ncbi:MAG TPA: head maturation protease, ClpP-related [Actinoplanes sp.]|jgi:ATP-dependent Clp endopeptidase proteolytic subunit ClpP